MIVQSTTKIFLAEERGLIETRSSRSQLTFNTGEYLNEHKQAVGSLYLLNDEMLAGGSSTIIRLEENSYLILLPVVGAIQYKDPTGNEKLLAAGQVQLIYADKVAAIEIRNPFMDEVINFLQIGIRTGNYNGPSAACLSTYDVNEFQNSLIKISPQRLGPAAIFFDLCIGKFSGRGETLYHNKKQNSDIFIFVIEGAFEVEGRLLHARDGLSLNNSNEIEMEALSNEAIVLLIEL